MVSGIGSPVRAVATGAPTLDRELMQQGRRQVVDEVYVVDSDHRELLPADGVECVGQHGDWVPGGRRLSR